MEQATFVLACTFSFLLEGFRFSRAWASDEKKADSEWAAHFHEIQLAKTLLMMQKKSEESSGLELLQRGYLSFVTNSFSTAAEMMKCWRISVELKAASFQFYDLSAIWLSFPPRILLKIMKNFTNFEIFRGSCIHDEKTLKHLFSCKHNYERIKSSLLSIILKVNSWRPKKKSLLSVF